jgi:hypothetical protein
MSLDPQCIFCQIVAGEAEASRVYRDPLVTAFMDLYPVTRGHLLVVPNVHFPNLASLDAQYAAQMMAAGRRAAAACRSRGSTCIWPMGPLPDNPSFTVTCMSSRATTGTVSVSGGPSAGTERRVVNLRRSPRSCARPWRRA